MIEIFFPFKKITFFIKMNGDIEETINLYNKSISLKNDDKELEYENFNLFPHQKKVLYYMVEREKNFLKNKECFFSEKKSFINSINNFFSSETFNSNENTKTYVKNIIKKTTKEYENNLNEISHAKKININLPAGTGKSYIALAIIEKAPVLYEKFINIIVVPSKLIFQWVEYIANFPVKSKVIILDNKEKIMIFNSYNINNHDNQRGLILLINSKMFEKINFTSEKKNSIHRMFFDEITSLCSCHGSNSFPCHYCSLFSKKKIVFPYFISENVLFDFKNITVNNDIINSEIKIPDFIYNIKNIIYLGHYNLIEFFCNNEIKKQIQKDIYDNAQEIFIYVFEKKIKEKKRLLKIIEKNNEETSSEILERFNSIDSTIKNIKERILKNECIICLEEKHNKSILLCCNISICVNCIIYIDKCIYCKKNLREPEQINIEELINHKVNEICKINVNENSKIVIIGNDAFSLNEKHLEEISENFFGTLKKYKIFKNSTKEAGRIISVFRDKNKYNILYFKNYTEIIGVNLEFVTDLIIDNIDSEYYRKKIIGKFQRIGRKTPLKIHDFFYKF